MQTTENVLKVVGERGQAGKPLTRLYRQLYKPELYLLAYDSIRANRGAITKGVNEQTLDGMSTNRIDKIIEKLKTGNYRWEPAKRVYIPKADGKGQRPLGMPTGDDKVLQSAMKLLLEAYYEPTFSDVSHGFRTGKGCHTALRQIKERHEHVSWFVEADIRDAFGSIDHEILLEIMGKNIKDGRFLKLVKGLLKAGYMENWMMYNTMSGTPQGGVISPLLSNIYLNELDKWMEGKLLPKYNRTAVAKRGGRRRNPEYANLSSKIDRLKRQGKLEEANEVRKIRKPMPYVMVNDPKYRKLSYTRYADDFILSFAGPKNEAEDIKREIKEFLWENLKLELSAEKTLITHSRTDKAKFLGYELRIMQDTKNRKRANGKMWFGIPHETIVRTRRKYMKRGKIVHRPEWIERSDYEIVKTYQSELRGLIEYYKMAHNLATKSRGIRWVVGGSMFKTLAAKHKSSKKKMSKKYKTTKVVGGQTYTVHEVEIDRTDKGKKPLKTHFGGISVKRQSSIKVADVSLEPRFNSRSDLLTRLMADKCEMCGCDGPVEVHHINALKNVHKRGRKRRPAWMVRMSAMIRKTLIVCKECHVAIHASVHRKEWDTYSNELN
jgi:group II intron reverse transcriptase/maturase